MKMFNVIFLFFLQSFVSCQKVPEKLLISDSKIMFQSEDGGKTWRDVGLGLSEELGLNCIYADQDEIFLGSESGVFRSNTQSMNLTWNKDLFINDRIYYFLPGRYGPYARSANNGLYQKISSTGIWIPKYSSLTDKLINVVLENPDGSILAGCGKGIFKSTDDGISWKQVYVEDNMFTMSMNDGVIIAGCSNGLIRSVDGGEHWTQVLTDDRGTNTIKVVGDRFFAITNVADAWKDNLNYNGKLANRLYSSNDNGLNWERMDLNMLPVTFKLSSDSKNSNVKAINDIIQVEKQLLCSIGNEIYRSSDHGKTWQLVLTSSKINKRFELVISGATIYAMLVNSGC